MTARLTNDEMTRRLARLTATAQRLGLMGEDDRAELVAPYGSNLYVMRVDAAGKWHHDMPGFPSGIGSAFLTRRAAADAVLVAAQVLGDLGTASRAEWAPYETGQA
jgi:hypothetical protein